MRNTFRPGDRAKTVVPIVLPHATVAAGIKGRIADVDPECPSDILFVPDEPSHDLADWNNFVPVNAEQIDAIHNTSWRNVGRAWIAAGFVGAALFIGQTMGPTKNGSTSAQAHVVYGTHHEIP